MLECINKECRQYKSGVCPKECDRRIKPTHIPNYAEEQLEYAKDNGTGVCQQQVKEPVNYEEEYEQIKGENSNLQATIKELHEEIEQVMQEKEKLKESNSINYNEYKEHLKKKNEHIRDLNQLIENKDIKIEKLERLKEVINEENEQLTNEYSNKIIIAEQEINRLNTEVACLKAFKEKDNKQIQNLKDAIKKLAEVL